MRALAVVCVLVALAPAAWADAPRVGTEANPELSDPAGNVSYSPLYQGPRDRDHLDLLSAWLEYDAVGDRLNLTVKVASLVDVDGKSQGWLETYSFQGNVSDANEDVGRLVFAYGKDASSDEWESDVVLLLWDRALDLERSFAAGRDAPGYLRWSTPLEPLRKFGVQIGDFFAVAGEDQFVAGQDVGIVNYNRARASTVYEYGSLEPAPVSQGDESPWPGASASGDVGPTSEATAGFVFAALVAAVVGAVGWRRRAR